MKKNQRKMRAFYMSIGAMVLFFLIVTGVILHKQGYLHKWFPEESVMDQQQAGVSNPSVGATDSTDMTGATTSQTDQQEMSTGGDASQTGDSSTGDVSEEETDTIPSTEETVSDSTEETGEPTEESTEPETEETTEPETEPPTEPAGRVTELSFTEPEIWCERGESPELDLRVKKTGRVDAVIPTWSSSNPEVVRIGANGRVTTLAGGSATITASVGDVSASVVIHVEVPLETAAISHTELLLARGETFQLVVGYLPVDTTEDVTMQWSSADEAVATVNGGLVTAVGIGTTELTVTFASYTFTCTITVHAPITGIRLSASALNMLVGQTQTLGVEILPADTTDDKTVTFASSAPDVVSVDAAGVLTSHKPGNATITVKVGGHTASCNVAVVIPLESFTLNHTVIDLNKGDTVQMSVSAFYPENTTSSKQVSWAISDASVLSVDANGLLTAVGGGTAVVGATVDGITVNCQVNVSVPLQSIGIAGGNVSVERERSKTLTVVYNPSDTTVNRAVTWTSSNPAVATVDAAGTVVGIANGTTVITATVGGISTSCEVTVIDPILGPQVTFVFDAGHGGIFPGASSTYNGVQYVEKDMNLKMALYTKAYLEEHYRGVTIYMTRTTDTQLSGDVAVDLKLRCDLAASVGADAMISFHFNGSTNHTGYGSTVLVSAQQNVHAASVGLANSILAQLSGLGLYNRGPAIRYLDAASTTDFYAINRYCSQYGIPGIIIEHCFMDNVADYPYFKDDAAMWRLAKANAEGIAQYYGLLAK